MIDANNILKSSEVVSSSGNVASSIFGSALFWLVIAAIVIGLIFLRTKLSNK